MEERRSESRDDADNQNSDKKYESQITLISQLARSLIPVTLAFFSSSFQLSCVIVSVGSSLMRYLCSSIASRVFPLSCVCRTPLHHALLKKKSR
jgi:hypothetical protein